MRLSSCVARASACSSTAVRAPIRVARSRATCVRLPARASCRVRLASTSAQAFNADAEAEAQIARGTTALQEGDLAAALSAFERSLQIKPTASAYFNLGVTHHAQDDIDAAIAAFEASIALEPSSDAFNNLSLLHVSRKPPDTARALELLRRAVEHAPSDPEVRYNLAVVLEASDKLDEALREYTAAKDLGVERAAVGIRNVGGKIVRRRVEQESAESAS